MSQSEKSIFEQEVKAFEEFAKVSIIASCTSQKTDRTSRPATSFRPYGSSVLCHRCSIQARYITTVIPFRLDGQKTLEDPWSEEEGWRWRMYRNLWSVSLRHCPWVWKRWLKATRHHRLDPVQITQMAKYLETVYVSGWQCSSTASSSLEPGPDLAGMSIIMSSDHQTDIFNRLPIQHCSQQGRSIIHCTAFPWSKTTLYSDRCFG